MDQKTRQEARETQPAQRERQPARGAFARAAPDAARAAAILRLGGPLTGLRPADAIALGSRVGNSSLGALLRGAPRVSQEPFVYEPAPEPLEPFPIRARPPAMCGGPGPFAGLAGLAPFPAAALGGGGGPAGWMGGAYGLPPS